MTAPASAGAPPSPTWATTPSMLALRGDKDALRTAPQVRVPAVAAKRAFGATTPTSVPARSPGSRSSPQHSVAASATASVHAGEAHPHLGAAEESPVGAGPAVEPTSPELSAAERIEFALANAAPGALTGLQERAHLREQIVALRQEQAETRRAVEEHAAFLRTVQMDGATVTMLRAATQHRIGEMESAWRREFEQARSKLEKRLDGVATVKQLEEMQSAKVDWGKLRPAVLTITKQHIRAFVQNETETVMSDVSERVGKIFDVDPSLRADMKEVAKLAARVVAAENECRRLNTLLSEGIDAKIAEAEEEVRQHVDGALEEFDTEASRLREESLSAVQSAEARLTDAINTRMTHIEAKNDEAVKQLGDRAEAKIQSSLVSMTAKIEDALAEVKKKADKAAEDGAAALFSVTNLKEEVAQIDERLKAVETTAARNQADIAQMQSERASAVGDLKQLKKELIKTGVTIMAVQETASKLEVMDDKLSARIDNVKDSVAEAAKQTAAQAASLVAKVKEEVKKLKRDQSNKQKKATEAARNDRKNIDAMKRMLSTEVASSLRELKKGLSEARSVAARRTKAVDARLGELKSAMKTVTEEQTAQQRHVSQELWRLEQAIQLGKRPSSASRRAGPPLSPTRQPPSPGGSAASSGARDPVVSPASAKPQLSPQPPPSGTSPTGDTKSDARDDADEGGSTPTSGGAGGTLARNARASAESRATGLSSSTSAAAPGEEPEGEDAASVDATEDAGAGADDGRDSATEVAEAEHDDGALSPTALDAVSPASGDGDEDSEDDADPFDFAEQLRAVDDSEDRGDQSDSQTRSESRASSFNEGDTGGGEVHIVAGEALEQAAGSSAGAQVAIAESIEKVKAEQEMAIAAIQLAVKQVTSSGVAAIDQLKSRAHAAAETADELIALARDDVATLSSMKDDAQRRLEEVDYVLDNAAGRVEAAQEAAEEAASQAQDAQDALSTSLAEAQEAADKLAEHEPAAADARRKIETALEKVESLVRQAEDSMAAMIDAGEQSKKVKDAANRSAEAAMMAKRAARDANAAREEAAEHAAEVKEVMFQQQVSSAAAMLTASGHSGPSPRATVSSRQRSRRSRAMMSSRGTSDSTAEEVDGRGGSPRTRSRSPANVGEDSSSTTGIASDTARRPGTDDAASSGAADTSTIIPLMTPSRRRPMSGTSTVSSSGHAGALSERRESEVGPVAAEQIAADAAVRRHLETVGEAVGGPRAVKELEHNSALSAKADVDTHEQATGFEEQRLQTQVVATGDVVIRLDDLDDRVAVLERKFQEADHQLAISLAGLPLGGAQRGRTPPGGIALGLDGKPMSPAASSSRSRGSRDDGGRHLSEPVRTVGSSRRTIAPSGGRVPIVTKVAPGRVPPVLAEVGVAPTHVASSVHSATADSDPNGVVLGRKTKRALSGATTAGPRGALQALGLPESPAGGRDMRRTSGMAATGAHMDVNTAAASRADGLAGEEATDEATGMGPRRRSSSALDGDAAAALTHRRRSSTPSEEVVASAALVEPHLAGRRPDSPTAARTHVDKPTAQAGSTGSRTKSSKSPKRGMARNAGGRRSKRAHAARADEGAVSKGWDHGGDSAAPPQRVDARAAGAATGSRVGGAKVGGGVSSAGERRLDRLQEQGDAVSRRMRERQEQYAATTSADEKAVDDPTAADLPGLPRSGSPSSPSSFGAWRPNALGGGRGSVEPAQAAFNDLDELEHGSGEYIDHRPRTKTILRKPTKHRRDEAGRYRVEGEL